MMPLDIIIQHDSTSPPQHIFHDGCCNVCGEHERVDQRIPLFIHVPEMSEVREEPEEDYPRVIVIPL